ncbi:MAG: site-specific integrase, partial [Ignavibacteriaceae bacterium]|nr:site-specific integrase [Ignavibacteriaceae bacterium]
MYLTKNGKSPFYQIVFFVDGKRKTKSTHTADIKKAQKFLISFRPENIVAKPTFDPISLSVFFKEYLTYKSQINSASYCKRSIIPAFNFLLSYGTDLPLHSITVKQIDAFITHTASRSASSAALYYRTLKAAFSKAVTWDYLNENPFKKIKTPKVQKSLPLFITKEEFNTILNYTTNQTLKDLFTFAFYTGMRLGEIVNCKWDWIDFKQNIIKTKCSGSFTTKSRKERIIPINPHLKVILQN